jgi:hypothetical protein
VKNRFYPLTIQQYALLKIKELKGKENPDEKNK